MVGRAGFEPATNWLKAQYKLFVLIFSLYKYIVFKTFFKIID
jgi:hypothetical protein